MAGRRDDEHATPQEPALVALAEELAEVARLVDDDDVPAVLNRLITRARRSVPGCDQAAITVHASDLPETVVATHPDLLACHDAQFEQASGPAVEALRHGEPRRVNDTAAETRWPEFVKVAADAGYRSVLALPLPALRHPSAVLTLYGVEPNAFRAISYDVAVVFAVQGGVSLDNVQLYRDSVELIGHLNTALASRAVIEQAKGIIMERDGCDADEAFAKLRTISQNTNTKLRKVAEQLVAESQRGDNDRTGG